MTYKKPVPYQGYQMQKYVNEVEHDLKQKDLRSGKYIKKIVKIPDVYDRIRTMLNKEQ